MPRILRRLRHDRLGHHVQARVCEEQLLYVCIRCGCWAQKRLAKLAKPCRGPPRPRDFGSAVLKRVEAGHHPLTPLRSEGPFADVVASDVHHIVLTQGVSSSAPGVIRRPTPGGYLDTVIARIRARL